MELTKLTIIEGIIQDKFIDGIPVNIKIVEPSGLNNVRTLKKMTEIIGITNHNTANISPTATDESHANWLQNVENADREYISVHLFVDDNSITQTIPLDEVSYHAGDGKGNGNYKTISIEICENQNVELAEENAKKLNAALILTYSHLKVYKHQDWSGKFCPHIILSRPNGWANFVADIQNYVNGSQNSDVVVPTPPTPSPIEIIPTYRVFANGKWFDWVDHYNITDCNGYAGIDNNFITAMMVKLSQGHIRYRAHILGGGWLDWVTDCNNDNYNGYAGIKGKVIDLVQMHLIGLDGYSVQYRVSNKNNINYLDWVRDYQNVNSNGYAGWIGKPIDKMQIRIVRK